MANNIVISTNRILMMLLVGGGLAGLMLGREICLRQSVLGIESDWHCDGHIGFDDWKDMGLEGNYFVLGSSLVILVVYLLSCIVACSDHRSKNLEAIFAVGLLLANLANGGLMAWYAAKGYSRSTLGYQSDGFVQSYIAAAVLYFLAALLSLGDALAVCRGI